MILCGTHAYIMEGVPLAMTCTWLHNEGSHKYRHTCAHEHMHAIMEKSHMLAKISCLCKASMQSSTLTKIMYR